MHGWMLSQGLSFFFNFSYLLLQTSRLWIGTQDKGPPMCDLLTKHKGPMSKEDRVPRISK